MVVGVGGVADEVELLLQDDSVLLEGAHLGLEGRDRVLQLLREHNLFYFIEWYFLVM